MSPVPPAGRHGQWGGLDVTGNRPDFSATPFGRSAWGLFREAELEVDGEKKRALRWSVVYYVLGASVVVLAAAAGTGALLELVSPEVAALITLGAAVLAAVNTWLNPDAQRSGHSELEAGWSTQLSYVQRVWESRPDPESGIDPEGWPDVLDSLERDATVLRRGVVPDAALPRWP